MLKLKDTKILFSLALPLVLSGLVESSLGFTSTVFLSHISAKILAAGSLVGWFFGTMMVIAWGLFSAVSMSIAHCDGANDQRGIAFVVRDGFWLAIVLSIPITVLVWNMAPILHLLGQNKALVTLAIPYLHALAFSVLPDFTGLLLLQLVVGLGHARTNLVFIVSWVILNVFANYALIFGHFGLPALGIAGLGWGTAFSFWVTTIAWAIYLLARKLYRPYFKAIFNFTKPYYYWELLKVGVPTGLMLCIEVSFFFAMALMIGHIGTSFLAASQIGMQYTGLFVSVLFAMAQAVTVRVGNRLGAKNPLSAHNAVHSGLLISLGFMSALAIFAWIFPQRLIAIDFSPHIAKNAFVISHAIEYLRIGVLALMFEAVRITLFGALRGLKDTRSTLMGSFLSFWLIAIPAGYIFADTFHFGAKGYWLGLLVGTVFGAGFLVWRYRVVMQRQFAS